MNVKYLAFIFLSLSVTYTHAQAKPMAKTSTQPAKPSKQTTIKYLNEKLNENCIGECTQEKTQVNKYDRDLEHWMPSSVYYHSFYYQNYLIEDVGSSAKLTITQKYIYKKVDYSGGDDNYDNSKYITVVIPIKKISSINIVDKKGTKTDTKIKIEETFNELIIVINTNESDISFEETSDGVKKFMPVVIIPINNVTEGEKIKKALLNLQTFYKEEIDPFAEKPNINNTLDTNKEENTETEIISSTFDISNIRFTHIGKVVNSQFPPLSNTHKYKISFDLNCKVKWQKHRFFFSIISNCSGGIYLYDGRTYNLIRINPTENLAYIHEFEAKFNPVSNTVTLPWYFEEAGNMCPDSYNYQINFFDNNIDFIGSSTFTSDIIK